MSQYFNPFNNYEEKEEPEKQSLIQLEPKNKKEIKIADAKKYFKNSPNNNMAIINMLKNSNISDNSIVYIIKVLISKIKDEKTKDEIRFFLN